MRKLIPFLLLQLFLFDASAQSRFQKLITTNYYNIAYGLRSTSDGGYVMVGSCTVGGFQNTQGSLAKVDANGDLLWMKSFGGSMEDVMSGCEQTSDGGYIVAGSSGTFGMPSEDVLVVRTDSSGNLLWSRTIGNAVSNRALDIKQTAEGNYIIVGQTYLASSNTDMLLILLDDAGDTLWVKSIGTGNLDQAESVQQTYDGGFVITGYATHGSLFGYGIVLAKTDADGNPLWTKTYDHGGHDYGFDVQQTTDSGFVISTNIPNGYGYQLGIIKTDANGDSLWTRYFTSPNDILGYSVKQTADQGYVFCGFTQDTTSDIKIFLLKLNANGDSLWTTVLGGTPADRAYDIEEAADGGFVMAGYNLVSGGPGYVNNALLIKTDSLGSAMCEQQIPNLRFGTLTPLVGSLTYFEHPSDITVTTPPLVMVNTGVSINACSGVGLQESYSELNIAIFPNPSTGTFTVSLPHPIIDGIFQVLNVMGELVFEERVVHESEKQIILQNQPPGIYMMRLIYGQKQLQTRHLIVQD